MGYSLYIERTPPLDHEEWLALVDSHPQLARADEAGEARNPRTGEVLRVDATPGDAVATAEQSRWLGLSSVRVELGRLTWLDGRVLLPPFDAEETTGPAMQLFASVASQLGGQVVGDEAETYTL